MARPKDDTWVVKDDEYHPDHTVAATHADLNAILASRDHHRREMLRLLALDEDTPLTGDLRVRLTFHSKLYQEKEEQLEKRNMEDE